MDELTRARIKQKLLQYPGATEASVEVQLDAYEERETFKILLISERGFSNAQAERFLDRQGYPRPPGWHSVFFYPSSATPRPDIVILLGAIVVGIWILAN
ncbi:MAG: hypothetical protein IH996_02390 [Proteobacteria bacterium]|nr:hypothetical protein [Pseudomonadota bacterium]